MTKSCLCRTFDYIPILLPKSAEDRSFTFDRIATGHPFYFAYVPGIDCLRNPGLSNTQRYCADFRPVLELERQRFGSMATLLPTTKPSLVEIAPGPLPNW